MKVSLITPTFQRQEHLRNLVAHFTAQTHQETELLILDDSPEPSDFFTSGEAADPRVRYAHSAEQLSIGEKRNRLIERSSGEVVMHFDDDDYYAPRYIERMLAALEGHDFVKLGRWFAYDTRLRQFFYWETDRLMRSHWVVSSHDELEPVSTAEFPPDFIERNLWGFGFSYVFRRSVFDTVRFDPVNWGEDFLFYKKLIGQGFRATHFPDEEGLALHVIHGNNTSRLFPQFVLPPFLVRPFFGPHVAGWGAPPPG